MAGAAFPAGAFLYGGLRWRDDGSWYHQMISPDGSFEEIPGAGHRLAFRICDEKRWCLGYFTFDGGVGDRLPCARGAEVTSGRQCDRCRLREGFSVVHRHRGALAELPLQIREYIGQPHLLYIACFGNGECKVGTATLTRRNKRLYEQGALLARFVASSPDGLHVRELEWLVSAAGPAEAVTIRAKMAALTGVLEDWPKLERTLETAVSQAVDQLPAGTTILSEPWTGGRRFYRRLQEYGRFLEVAPPPSGPGEYVLDAVDAHGHTLLCRESDGSAELVLVNESPFIGRRITLDDAIENKPSATQIGLF